jgi:hypothetical protein
MTKRRAPRHLADAKGAGGVVFGDRRHLTQNQAGSKSPRHRVAQGDVVHVITARHHSTGSTLHFFWVLVKPLQVTDAVVALAIQTGVGLHGPFPTEEAARIDALGPDCKVTHCGVWNPEWEKQQ